MAGMVGASPVARKEADVAVTVSAQAAALGDQAHVQETDIPYSIACSGVPSSPSGLHLGACASIVRMATEVSLDAHHHGASAEAPQLLNQTGHPTLTISTEEPWRDRRFDHLKTFSSGSRVERQLSTFHPHLAEIEDVADSKISEEEEATGDGDGDNENEVPSADWYVFMTPILLLDLKIYGQWMSGGGLRLSKVANPTSHLAIVGNFVGALLGALVGLHEAPLFFFAVGLAHYAVLFVTLYQWLDTNDVRLPKELHPVFFLFVAVPSVASMAWARLCGEFGFGAKIPYFISLFLFMSLVVSVSTYSSESGSRWRGGPTRSR
ncbi:unnamed protein product [Miscanthus lutarioriparius]|uniref:Uncharacterized protein n=1 Tax=Miscanthus lutarioriparius TaxID=422564 RepID=A0A811RSN5_9POAL|nr:unnamed protein product [Miscanthus lutarioriparius]